MYRDLKNILKHGSVYMVGIILGRIVSFIMIPVYTNYLTPDDYGILQILSVTIDAIATIFGMDMASAVVRTYQQFEDPQQQRRVISSALLGSMTVMGIVSASCLLLSPQFSQLIFSNDTHADFFRLTFVAMFFASGIELPMLFLRIRLKSGNYVIISTLKLALQLTLNIWFLVGLELGVVGILYSNVISAAVFAGYLTISTFRITGISFDFAKYKEIIRVGAPLIVSGVSAFILTYSNRYFLNYLTDLATVGIYSLATTFGMILSVIVNSPFVSVWNVELFKYGKQENGKAIFSKVLIYYLLVSLTFSLALSLLTRDALRIMADEAYWSAFKYVPLVVLAYVLHGSMYIVSAGILLAGRTKYRAYSSAIAMAANLAMNFALIPLFGAWGAAIATVVAHLIRLLIDSSYAQRFYKVDYDWRKVFTIGGLFVVILVPTLFVHIENIVLSVVVSLAMIALFPVLSYFSGVLSAEEKHWARRLLRNPISAIKDLRAGAST